VIFRIGVGVDEDDDDAIEVYADAEVAEDELVLVRLKREIPDRRAV
jgi:hypothetical protein